jgi:hypothetical protein
MLACGTSGGGDDGDGEGTAAAQTIEANNLLATMNAQSAMLTAQAGGQEPPAPQATEPPAGETGLPTISASADTNCRQGPGVDYSELGYLMAGGTSSVHGKEPSGNWWYIQNPQKPGEYCWVWEGTTTVSGDTSGLPLVEPPPLPEPEKGPAQTEPPQKGPPPQEPPGENPPPPEVVNFNYEVSFSNIHLCGDYLYAFFEIRNTGNIPLKWHKVMNHRPDGGKFLGGTGGNGAFISHEQHCLSPSEPVLDPGYVAYIPGNIGKPPMSEPKVESTIKVCSEVEESGICQTKVLVFSPK